MFASDDPDLPTTLGGVAVVLRKRPLTIVRKASRSDRPVLSRLLELYQYDLSTVGGRDLDYRARYGYRHLDAYWTERGRFAYLVQVDGRWAGFALVNKHSPLGSADWAIAEFFILAPYRQRGTGERLAHWVFEQHEGTWHVAELRENRPAQRFWRKVIRRFTSGRYREMELDDERWRGPVQIFLSTR
jgi:predicted acetyltransferase